MDMKTKTYTRCKARCSACGEFDRFKLEHEYTGYSDCCGKYITWEEVEYSYQVPADPIVPPRSSSAGTVMIPHRWGGMVAARADSYDARLAASGRGSFHRQVKG